MAKRINLRAGINWYKLYECALLLPSQNIWLCWFWTPPICVARSRRIPVSIILMNSNCKWTNCYFKLNWFFFLPNDLKCIFHRLMQTSCKAIFNCVWLWVLNKMQTAIKLLFYSIKRNYVPNAKKQRGKRKAICKAKFHFACKKFLLRLNSIKTVLNFSLQGL